MQKCGLIILAAGASRRLLQPKQALPYQGTTLLQHGIQTALSATPGPIIVVAGAYVDPQSVQDRVQLIINQEWSEGMASSIRLGLSTLIRPGTGIEEVIIMVCDQPFVSAALLTELIRTSAATGKGISASSYRNTVGTPVLFSQKYFGKLMALQGDEGAKKIVRQHMDDVAVIPFPNGEIDIDTMEDYQDLIQHRS